jgi:hypothetical protein
MARTAECACRSFKVRVEAEPIVVGACNCTQCQRRSGSVFAVVAYFPKDNVQVVSGAYKTFDYTADSGRKGEMHFCPECGSTVFWDAEYRRDLRGVAVGCFADPTFPPPQSAAYNRSRHPWVTFPPGIKLYDTTSLAAANAEQPAINSKPNQ